MKKRSTLIILGLSLILHPLWAESVIKMTPNEANELWKKATTGTNIALHSKVIFSQKPTYSLTASGDTDATDLTDGVISEIVDARIWFDAKAVGWYESGASGGFNILMDLGKVQPIDHAVLRVLAGKYNWAMVSPQRFEVFISKDGKDFYPVAMLGKLKPGESSQSDWVNNYYLEENGTAFVYPFDFKIRTEARYIGITVAGETDAVFMDEIAVMAPKTPLTRAEIDAPYQGKATAFHTEGLIVAPRIGSLVISSNVHTPNYFMAADMRPGKGLKDPLHLTIEVPEQVEIVQPAAEKSELFKIKGYNYRRITFTIGKSPFKIPFTDAIFFTVNGNIPKDATATIYDADNTVNPVRQTFPIEIIKIPEVGQPFKQLQISLSWMDEAESLQWPNFMAEWKKFGFNAVGTFPRYYEGRDDVIQKFLTGARQNGYKIVMQETPCINMAKGQNPGGEPFSQVDSNDSKNLCPTYRGQFYQQDLERIKKNVLACRPDYVFWDIELWQEGGDDGLTGRCKRCGKAIAASGKPADEFLKESGTEMLRDAYSAVKEASIKGKFPMPLIGSYNHHAVIPVHQVVADFDRNYPKYIKQSQPSLYVGGKAAMVHDSVRGNYQKIKTRDILPWLSAGTYGELEPRKLEQEILEALLNGAIGFTYYWSGDFDTPMEYYYHARPLALLRPHEDLLVNGNVLEPTGSNTALYYSGIGRKNEMLLLVGNYNRVNESTVYQMPAGLQSATDLFSKEKLKAVDGKLSLEVPKDGIRLLYLQ